MTKVAQWNNAAAKSTRRLNRTFTLQDKAMDMPNYYYGWQFQVVYDIFPQKITNQMKGFSLCKFVVSVCFSCLL